MQGSNGGVSFEFTLLVKSDDVVLGVSISPVSSGQSRGIKGKEAFGSSQVDACNFFEPMGLRVIETNRDNLLL